MEDSEEILHAFVEISAIKAGIRDGSFSQALHIAGFYLCLEFLQLRDANTGP